MGETVGLCAVKFFFLIFIFVFQSFVFDTVGDLFLLLQYLKNIHHSDSIYGFFFVVVAGTIVFLRA